MGGMKRKRRYRRSSSNGANASKRSAGIRTKNLEIFVTDFLTDPCALPAEFRDCALVDGRTSLNNHPADLCSSNNSQVLKKIFANNESMECVMKNSLVEETGKKPSEFGHQINI